ncbi:MAG: helix-turn-helix domain-containing protein [Bacteroidetes bacterium]|nr:helix-turn-helix domain-containing protein [Bacteroidota bacterium]
MEIICLEEPAFYVLIEKVYARLIPADSVERNRWVTPGEAMSMLNIKSKTSLQSLRDNGKIRFSQPQKRVILYDRISIEEYLDKNAKNTF